MNALRLLVLSLCLLLSTANAPAWGSSELDPVGAWPLRPTPEIVQHFDPPVDPWGSGHRGVDLAGTVGQPVHSAMAGTVAFVGVIAGRPVVTIAHGETRTTYEPVASALEVGAVVAAGTRIGSLQLQFSHCFPAACLHWGWLRGETYLDPTTLVGDGPVRLLPLWRAQPVDHGATGSVRRFSLAGPSSPGTSWRSLLWRIVSWQLPSWPDAAWAPPQPPERASRGARVAFTPGGGPAGRPVGAGPW